MKNIVENKVNILVEKYKYNTILTLIICILFFALRYSGVRADYKLYIDDKQAGIDLDICEYDGKHYIYIDDLVELFSDNVYYDKISGKIIITTYDNIIKFNKNDEKYNLKRDNNIYLDLKQIVEDINKEMVVSNNNIYISTNNYIDANVKNNRTELYDIVSNNVITLIDKSDAVKLIIDDNSKQETSKIVKAVVEKENLEYYGYVLKENVDYQYVNSDAIEKNDKVLLVKADNKLMSSTDIQNITMAAINMYRLSGVNSLLKLDFADNIPEHIDAFATINNGYTSANFDSDITVRMLNSEKNREEIIQKLLSNVKNMNGVCIDFGGLKSSDKMNFTQFIKELAAILHTSDKKLIVNVSNTQYMDVAQILKFVDYIVIQPYTARTINSKTSGPISSISYVEKYIKEILVQDVDSKKIILELPAYSILWTERKGTVINAEKYDMATAKEYISMNELQVLYDSTSGQNYINYNKGITTYKMWLEDKLSATEKAKLAVKYNLAGVSVYRSGMELKEIYGSISNELNK